MARASRADFEVNCKNTGSAGEDRLQACLCWQLPCTPALEPLKGVKNYQSYEVYALESSAFKQEYDVDVQFLHSAPFLCALVCGSVIRACACRSGGCTLGNLSPVSILSSNKLDD